ncbi:MAG: diguanylate cyclase domain-containing protein [Methylophilus sp.]|uniref:GGDEF domain-containing protein n=1 Tax=Methylophilus sp. TaxID=29541 RepID=UPI003F9F42CA
MQLSPIFYRCLLLLSLLLLSLLFAGAAFANPAFANPLFANPTLSDSVCQNERGQTVQQIPLYGGKFTCHTTLTITAADSYVLDFKNTTVIANFNHQLSAADGKAYTAHGGLNSAEKNPYLLRHGRKFDLSPGTYQLSTQLNSPYFLAQPELFIATEPDYLSQVLASSAGAILMLGVLMGIFVYYIAIGLAPGHVTERMYALFILGNLIFQGAALGAFAQLADSHWFYLSSAPILLSNIAYVAFVRHLLGINATHYPRLHQFSLIVYAILVALLVNALINPNWMLEMARTGVAIFLVFGFICGSYFSWLKHRTAQYYLIAITVFGVLGGMSISAQKLSTNIWTIEQMGLIAVTVEAILLALVLAYQINRLHKDKDRMLVELQDTRSLALTDRLTNLPNRHALEGKMLNFPAYGCLIFLDMDNLKHFNDHFGHDVGDTLLKNFSLYLNQRLGREAQLYRLGGDEFAILCHEDEVEWCQHQVEATNKQLQVGGFIGAGASQGVVFAREANTPAELMRIADKRMYANKRSRKDRKEMLQVLQN